MIACTKHEQCYSYFKVLEIIVEHLTFYRCLSEHVSFGWRNVQSLYELHPDEMQIRFSFVKAFGQITCTKMLTYNNLCAYVHVYAPTAIWIPLVLVTIL